MKKLTLKLLFVALFAANISFAQSNTKENYQKEVNSHIELVTLNYEPNTTSDIVFRHVYNSPDGNWIKGVSIQFPDGVTVNSATSCLETEGTLTYNGETGNGALATWGDTEVGTGMGDLNLTGEFSVNVTIAEDFAGEMTFIWKIIGDGFGEAPHFNEGTLHLMQPVNNDLGIYKISDFPTDIVREGSEYSLMIKIYNYGLDAQVNKPINLDINGITYTETLSNIDAGSYETVVFNGLVAQAGKSSHTISVPEDDNNLNDTIILDLVFAPNSYNAFEFEDDSFNPIWEVTSNFGLREGGYGSLLEKCLAAYHDESNIGTYIDTIKTNGTIFIGNDSENQFMSFYLRGFTIGVKPNSLNIIYSTDNKNWEVLKNIEYSDEYELIYIDLSSLLPQGYYYIGMETTNTTAEAEGVFSSSQYIDNLIIPEFKTVSLKESLDVFNIYPNPTRDKFFVETNENYTLQIIDLSGKVVSTHKLDSFKNTININGTGIYLLKFIGENKVFCSKIIVE